MNIFIHENFPIYGIPFLYSLITPIPEVIHLNYFIKPPVNHLCPVNLFGITVINDWNNLTGKENSSLNSFTFMTLDLCFIVTILPRITAGLVQMPGLI